MEGGEPEAVIMSFDEYVRLTGTSPAPAESVRTGSAGARPVRHATEERLDMPLSAAGHSPHDARGEQGFSAMEETELVPSSGEWMKPVPHDTAIRLADIRLEDLPI
jgi:hypothetical protein